MLDRAGRRGASDVFRRRHLEARVEVAIELLGLPGQAAKGRAPDMAHVIAGSIERSLTRSAMARPHPRYRGDRTAGATGAALEICPRRGEFGAAPDPLSVIARTNTCL